MRWILPSSISKATGFAIVLALVFGAAALAGSRIDAHPGKRAPKPGARGMGAMGAGAADPVRGLAVSEGGFTLDLQRTAVRAGRAFDLSFRITRGGRAVRAFDVEHTKRMHLIVVRRDMTGFQHLHPAMAPDGTWSVAATLRDPGAYRVFADFAVGGTPHTLAGDITADGAVRWHALPAPAPTTIVDGMRVGLRDDRGELAFDVTRAGRPVAIEDYLGAKGHLVALREGDLAFLHVHPDANRLRFMAEFPTAGRYRLFLQFKAGGRVHTAAFTKEVAR